MITTFALLGMSINFFIAGISYRGPQFLGIRFIFWANLACGGLQLGTQIAKAFLVN